MPLFRHDERLIHFVHIPKTGGSSIEAFLRANGATAALLIGGKAGFFKSAPQHMHAEVHARVIPPGFVDWSFTVVRNPLDRMLSEFRMRGHRADAPTEFDDWVPWALDLYRKRPFALDNHLRPQHEFVDEDTQVFRFEDGLQLAADAVAAKLDLKAREPLPHRRAFEGGTDTVRVGEAARRAVLAFYAEDFARFGYDG